MSSFRRDFITKPIFSGAHGVLPARDHHPEAILLRADEVIE